MDTTGMGDLQTVLEGVALPAHKHELLKYVLVQGVNADLLVRLAALPDGEYRSIDEVAETLSGLA